MDTGMILGNSEATDSQNFLQLLAQSSIVYNKYKGGKYSRSGSPLLRILPETWQWVEL